MIYVKCIGGLLIVVACFLLGNRCAFSLIQRTKNLNSMKIALLKLEGHILNSAMPIPMALSKLSEGKEFYAEYFTNVLSGLKKNDSLSRAWEGAGGVLSRNYLKKTDIEIINELGGFLGLSNRQTQKKYFDICFLQLGRNMEEAMFEQRKYGNMTKSLGLLVGLLIFIIVL